MVETPVNGYGSGRRLLPRTRGACVGGITTARSCLEGSDLVCCRGRTVWRLSCEGDQSRAQPAISLRQIETLVVGRRVEDVSRNWRRRPRRRQFGYRNARAWPVRWRRRSSVAVRQNPTCSRRGSAMVEGSSLFRLVPPMQRDTREAWLITFPYILAVLAHGRGAARDCVNFSHAQLRDPRELRA